MPTKEELEKLLVELKRQREVALTNFHRVDAAYELITALLTEKKPETLAGDNIK